MRRPSRPRLAKPQPIWAAAGLRLTWVPEPTSDRQGGRVVFVLVRPVLGPSRRDEVSSGGRRRTALGRVLFNDEGVPGNIIEVGFDSVRATVAKASRLDVPVARLPPMGLRHLTGRALGRVIAHEVGHWLLGRGHAKEGLMKPRLRGGELVDAVAPPLPQRWTVAGAALPLTAASRCELEPHALSNDVRVVAGDDARRLHGIGRIR